MSEFDLIAKYFTWNVSNNNGSFNQSDNVVTSSAVTNSIVKSIGDDAAVLSLAPNQQLVTSIDTLVSGVHFPIDTPAFDIGHKALAVNLSDLAAMGAKPEWFTLALTLPPSSDGLDHQWLSEFSAGLKTLAEEAGIALIGGDTTSGPLSISIQVMGSVEAGKALYRSGAKSGDKIYVTATLGDGAAGLASIQNKLILITEHAEYCQRRLNRPTPRLNESALIKFFASACIDVSDGLLQDLRHILKQSSGVYSNIDSGADLDNNLDNSPNNNFDPDSKTKFGAKLDLSNIPLSPALKSIDLEKALAFALTGGDDYEILFTIPQTTESQFLEVIDSSPYQFTCIGSITNEKGIVDQENKPLTAIGYNHFHE